MLGLRIKNLTKKYREKVVLKTLSVDFGFGSIVSIAGKNGCGKSTLLKIIAGLAEKDSGEVIIPEGKTVAALIETPFFFDGYNGYDNISAFVGDADRTEVNKLAEAFDLAEEMSIRVSKYSLGMRQKLGIIVTLLTNADVLLFDEPINALDQKAISVFKELITEQKRLGKLIIISSHDLSLINTFSDKLYDCKDGVLTENLRESIVLDRYFLRLADEKTASDSLKAMGFDVQEKDGGILVSNVYVSKKDFIDVVKPFDIKEFKVKDDEKRII